ncbi:MAG: hypothetical protein QOD28_2126 [Acidobacteriota bacterium]|nr:hypothetical protein [Acidobacteriota bacterium]
MKRLFHASLCLLWLAGATAAQNWPQFRGANASGVATGASITPVSWNASKSENVVGEPLMATPAISGNLLIVRSQGYVYGIGKK